MPSIDNADGSGVVNTAAKPTPGAQFGPSPGRAKKFVVEYDQVERPESSIR
jgi:hypothetical protein